ncbi:2-hydroxychromene-2-carboxylate isomerase [Noviherbaspirillum galbum]|uniref:2-hydroxychromene-2-carboxylate isomerase n=1 Tax=Noviherbaspirillum galbum TaxID=2709383 RepID=A0A6B3SFI0_9BURK|nr:2-hydroxychromene-2-carboxylate isomerase [Noviherbaspirillum galbum]NEX59581.1 2-hydroxychromene-2-carboxylate isomerase [Noviherbaspirillum galbum]
MSKQVEFFFDVGSPYSYLAFHELPKIAARRGAEIKWRPMLLGGVFQATGNHSPVTIPAKAVHLNVDLERWAKHFGVTFQMPRVFPINTLPLMRGAVAMQRSGPKQFHRYLAAVFAAMFEHPRNLGEQAELASVLEEAGFDPAQFVALINDPAVKAELKDTTEEAVRRGVFGAPAFFVGNEMFWGQDRLHFVEQALA